MSLDLSLSLAGKVAIITGSGKTTGIGAAIALTLARAGAKVVINFVSDSTAAEAEAVAKGIETVAGAGAVAVVQADIGCIEGSKKLVEESLSKLQVDKIDIIGKTDTAPSRVPRVLLGDKTMVAEDRTLSSEQRSLEQAWSCHSFRPRRPAQMLCCHGIRTFVSSSSGASTHG